jgi:hypothetical protein
MSIVKWLIHGQVLSLHSPMVRAAWSSVIFDFCKEEIY